jgi:hypothetical protein
MANLVSYAWGCGGMEARVEDDEMCTTTRASTIERLRKALNRRQVAFMSTFLARRRLGFREAVICLACASIRGAAE